MVGKVNISGEDRFFHLQITASGLNKLGQDSDAELFKKIRIAPRPSVCILTEKARNG